MMRRAILLGEKARLTASPNPWVGCLLEREGTIIGEGFTQPGGRPHAETVALAQAGVQAKGSTAYVSLEPCSHHGVTGPCAEALIKAHVAKVVIALTDPDPRVSGQGIALLRAAGLSVTVGVGEKEAENSLRPYLHQRRTGLPYCVLKAAISLDGRITAADGTSRWISGEAARQNAHRLRAESQAVMIGSGTAQTDLPSLTVRGDLAKGHRQPLRILCDTSGKTPAKGPLFDTSLAPTLVFTSSRIKQMEWEAAGAEVVILPQSSLGGVDLKTALLYLGERGILQILVEGGSHLFTSFIRTHLAQELILYLGPKLLGKGGVPLLQELGDFSVSQAPNLHLIETLLFDSTVRLRYFFRNSSTIPEPISI